MKIVNSKELEEENNSVTGLGKDKISKYGVLHMLGPEQRKEEQAIHGP